MAPTNGNNVVIAAGSPVFVSTNALAATVGPPTGVTFTDITRNLPGRNVARAAFDPVDPNVIYAVLTGFDAGTGQNVFRTTVTATSWTNISPPVDVPCGAIAVDGTTIPTTLYVGTDLGVVRSVDGGASWSVLDDIHFPRVPVFDLAFNAKAGMLRAGTYGRGVFEFAKPAGPSIAIHLQNGVAVGLTGGLAFGTVCSGPQFLDIEVYNVGSTDLVLTSVQRLMGSPGFVVLPTPSTPVVLAPGEDIEFTVAVTPPPSLAHWNGPPFGSSAMIQPPPLWTLTRPEYKAHPTLGTAIVDNGFIGNACLGSFADAELTINNSGACPLTVWNIFSSSAEFQTPLFSAPLLLGSGDSTEVTIRFLPASFGAKAATISLVSNDPAGVQTVAVSGFAPAPRLALVIANTGSFGNCCVGSFKDEPLILNNSGQCTLTVTSITSSSGEFLVPLVLSYPLTIEAGGDLEVPIRFQPASFGAKAATITVTSDDPAGPQSIALSGNAPSGKLAVTGSAYFGGVKCCRRAFRTIAVCNVGDCDLHVSKVAFEHKNRHWRLVHNPFPATLHPGSCLNVVIRYKATQREPMPCELVITSDDPLKPVREVEVIAWTRCCCKECCEECHHGRRCDEAHKECCEEHHRECCEEPREECEEEGREGRREGEGREDDREEPHDERHEERRHKGRHHGEHEEDEDDD